MEDRIYVDCEREVGQRRVDYRSNSQGRFPRRMAVRFRHHGLPLLCCVPQLAATFCRSSNPTYPLHVTKSIMVGCSGSLHRFRVRLCGIVAR